MSESPLIKLRELADDMCDKLVNRQRLELFAARAAALRLDPADLDSPDAVKLAGRLSRLKAEAEIEGMPAVVDAIASLRRRLADDAIPEV